MVPKHTVLNNVKEDCFRAVLFRMVPKQADTVERQADRFRAVLFRMVPKLNSF